MDTTKNLCRSAGRPTIHLERRTTAHAAEIFALLAAPELYEFIEEEPLASVEAWRQKLERSESGRSPDGAEHWLNWIVRDASGAAAGYVQATVHASRETSVAYLFAAAFQGRGIATEAVSQMLERVASEHGVTRFRIVAERRNSRSILLAQRLGFAEATPERAALAGIAPLDILLLKEVASAVRADARRHRK